MPKKFSETVKIAAVKHYRETFNYGPCGKEIRSLRKTAELFNCSWSTISQWLKEYPGF